MPYAKNYSKPRRGKGKIMSTSSKALRLATQALSLAMMLKKLMNVERKFHIVAATHAPSLSTWNISLLSGIAQGDTSQTRDGNKCKAISLHCQGNAFLDSSASATVVRIIIFKDKSSQGAQPVATDLLQTQNYISSYNNVNCPYRFKVLLDKTIDLSSTGTQVRNFDYFIKLQQHLTYGGAGGNQSDCEQGHLYIATLSNETTNLPDIVFNNRLTFVDN